MIFWLKYILVALIGTAALYCCIPLIHPELYAASSANDADAENLVEPFTDPAEETVGETAAKPAVSRSKPRRPVQAKPKSQQSAVKVVEDDSEPEVIVENVINFKPSTDVIRSSGAGVTHWGVTVKETALYAKDGKNLKAIPAGTLIEQTDVIRADKGEMSHCKLWKDGTWSGPFLIAAADLIRFEGTRERTDAADVEKICTYYTLVQKCNDRKNEILKTAAAKNPYYKEFKEKAETYNKNADRAAELTKQRDTAKGAARTKLISELTKLKQDEAKQSAELSKIKAKYEDWKKKNSQAEANYNTDPIYQKLAKQVLDLKDELSDFGI